MVASGMKKVTPASGDYLSYFSYILRAQPNGWVLHKAFLFKVGLGAGL